MKPLKASDKVLRREGPIEFMQFGFDRLVPDWVPCDTSRTVVHIGPGIKRVEWEDCTLDYPAYDLDSQYTIRDRGSDGLPAYISGRSEMPFADESVGGIYAVNVLEHLYDIRWIIQEAARVLAPGCPFNIFVPHPDSIMHMEDADHKSRQVIDSWDNLLSNPYYTKGKNGIPLRVGMNLKIAVKEDNTAVMTQLIKEESANG